MKNIDLLDQYKAARPLYENYTNKLTSLIKDLLSSHKIEYHLLESRTKDLNSFQEKIIRKHNKYSKLSEVTDLSGLRIIVYYPVDIDKAIFLFKEHFEIDTLNSKIEGNSFNPNEFGYLSSHIVFKLTSNRLSLPEWESFNDFYCEVQIRTVLQHAWASISHALQYKTQREVPSDLQRKLFRLAGLFELADEQFSNIKEIHEALTKEISSDDVEVSDRELNLLSVLNFISKSSSVKMLYSFALDSGFTDQNEEPEIEIQIDERETISGLITICELLNINEIMQLEKVLKAINPDEAKLLFRKLFRADRGNSGEWYVSPAFILTIYLIYLSVDKLNSEFLVEIGWTDTIAEKVIEIAFEVKKSI
jgi:putative GTP pyrophosphokinase